MNKYLKVFERSIVYVLLIMMTFVIILATVDLAPGLSSWIFY